MKKTKNSILVFIEEGRMTDVQLSKISGGSYDCENYTNCHQVGYNECGVYSSCTFLGKRMSCTDRHWLNENETV